VVGDFREIVERLVANLDTYEPPKACIGKLWHGECREEATAVCGRELWQPGRTTRQGPRPYLQLGEFLLYFKILKNIMFV
jgi:hypothetical protein